MPQKNNFNLSIIIPVYNEEQYLAQVFKELKNLFNNKEVEIIFINDGSNDKSRNILEDFKKNNFFFNLILINLEKNYGKGYAVRQGIKKSKGNYVLLHDADLELDLKDANEIYQIIKNRKEIKCIFGSRYLSGKLKKNNYFFNNLIGKLNSIIFSIFFLQSLTDVHCGLKIMRREVVEKLNLSINDFGIELDIASQIVRNKFYIYEYGISYYFRTKKEGKKISWLDGLKSIYYLFKIRFIDNDSYTTLSLIISTLYMAYVGSYFGMGLGNIIFMLVFILSGLIIGLNFKILSSLIIFFFIFMGSLFSQGNGKSVFVLLFFFIGIFVAKYINKLFLKSKFANWF